MKLGAIGRGTTGEWRPAAFVDDGAIDLRSAVDGQGSNVVGLLATAPADPRWLHPDYLPEVAAVVARACRAGQILAHGSFVTGPPVARPGKIIACGRNYLDHLREGQKLWAERGRTVRRPQIPAAFIKLGSAITHHGAIISIPADITDIDYEVELAVVIGRPAYRVAEANALDHVAGYTICNDLATRSIQFAEMEQQIGIVMGKNLPGFAPIGPCMVTADELPSPQSLAIGLKVNGQTRQEASTSDMLFGVAELVAYWSKLGLDTGDMLLTGTPAGVAVGRPVEERADFFLKHGDLVEAWVSGIGTLSNRIELSP